MAASTIDQWMQGLIFLDRTMQGLEVLQLKTWRHFPWLGAPPDPFSPACVCGNRTWDEYPEQGERNQGWEWGAGLGVLSSRRRRGDPAPHSPPWRTCLDQAPVAFRLVVLLQLFCSDGKLTNNKWKHCFQTVQKNEEFWSKPSLDI